MSFFKRSYAIGISILVAIFIFLPVFNVDAGENDNFLITVETDKEAYEAGETVEYLIKIKNISSNEVKDVSIIDELPSNIKVIETDGQINGNKISWEKEGLLPEEEVVLHLSIQLNEVTATPPVDGDDKDDDTVPPPSGDTGDGDTPSKGEASQVTPSTPISKPSTGYNNLIIAVMGIILSGLGYLLYKVNGKKIGKFFILTLLCSGAITMTSETDVNAETINVSQEYTHSVKIDGETIESKITLVAQIESNTSAPLIDAEDIMIYRGDSFNPLDKVSAHDSVDGDITANIKVVQNDVNTNQVGKYVVIYEVENSRGTIARKEIFVTVAEKESLDGTLCWDTDTISAYLRNETVELNIHCEGTDLSPYLNNIEWWLENTDISGQGNEIKFNAPSIAGEYTLNAKLVVNEQEYHLTKKIIVADKIVEDPMEDEKDILTGEIIPELNPSEDEDLDGIINKEEEAIGTDPYQKDTDLDGLDDYSEINKYGTNPINDDTDGDGTIDGYELLLGFNPLTPDKQDVYTKELVDNENQVSLIINGSADVIVNTQIERVDDAYLSNTAGTVGNIIDITTIGNIDEATLTFSYDIDEVNQKGLDENSLSVYYLDEENLELIKLDSNINLETKEVSTTINHFSKYVLGDSSKINVKLGNVDIVFVLDNSGSMDSNDPQKKRLSVTKDLVTSLEGDLRFGLVKFSSWAQELVALDSNKDNFYKGLDSITYTDGGTDFADGINGGLSVFENNDHTKVMVFLTDGEDGGSNYARDLAIQEAQNKGVKIFTVGLGNNLNFSLLEEIANKTNGLYVHSENAEELKEAFEGLEVSLVPPTGSKQTTIRYDGVDRKVELIAKNGFDIDQHGYQFRNISTKESSGGNCHGLASTSYLMYLGKMPHIGKDKWEDLSYDLSMTENLGVNKLNVDEIDINWTIQFNQNKGFYETGQVWYVKRGSDDKIEGILTTTGYALNDQGKEYYEKTGMYIETVRVGIQYYEVPTPVSPSVSVNDLKAHGDFTEQDVNTIKSIAWWQEAQQEDVVSFDDILMYEQLEDIQEAIEYGVVRFFIEDDVTGEEIGGHAVVAQALYKSSELPNTYYLEIYDSNDPGFVQYIEMKVKHKYESKWFGWDVGITTTVVGEYADFDWKLSSIKMKDIKGLLNDFIWDCDVEYVY